MKQIKLINNTYFFPFPDSRTISIDCAKGTKGALGGEHLTTQVYSSILRNDFAISFFKESSSGNYILVFGEKRIAEFDSCEEVELMISALIMYRNRITDFACAWPIVNHEFRVVFMINGENYSYACMPEKLSETLHTFYSTMEDVTGPITVKDCTVFRRDLPFVSFRSNSVAEKFAHDIRLLSAKEELEKCDPLFSINNNQICMKSLSGLIEIRSVKTVNLSNEYITELTDAILQKDTGAVVLCGGDNGYTIYVNDFELVSFLDEAEADAVYEALLQYCGFIPYTGYEVKKDAE